MIGHHKPDQMASLCLPLSPSAREVRAFTVTIAGILMFLTVSLGTSALYLLTINVPSGGISVMLYGAHWLLVVVSAFIAVGILLSYYGSIGGNAWWELLRQGTAFTNSIGVLYVEWIWWPRARNTGSTPSKGRTAFINRVFFGQRYAMAFAPLIGFAILLRHYRRPLWTALCRMLAVSGAVCLASFMLFTAWAWYDSSYLVLRALSYAMIFATLVGFAILAWHYRRPLSTVLRRLLAESGAFWLSLVVLFTVWSWCHWPGEGAYFQALTVAALFNGVSPVLSCVLAATAIIVLGYTMARQHYLINECQKNWPDHELMGFPGTQFVDPLRATKAGIAAAVVLAIVALIWASIARATINTGVDAARSAMLFLSIAAASLVWWWLFVEAWFLSDCLLEKLRHYHKMWLAESEQGWKKIFDDLGRDAVHNIGRFLYGPRPRVEDRAGQLIEKYGAASPEMRALAIYRIAQVGCKQICLLVIGLAVSAILIILAAVGYPFNTAPSLRFLMSITVLAMGGCFLWRYIQLDRDPLLSRMLGSTPYVIAWSWTLAWNAVLVLGAAGIAIVAQMVPGVWTWLWSAVQRAIGVTG